MHCLSICDNKKQTGELLYDICSLFQKIQQFGGLCGPCGDPYDGERENEAEGKYALGIISKQLPDGAKILETKVVNTAFHKGYYEFRICANNDVTKAVTQDCLNENLMTVMEGDDRYPTRFYPPGPGEHLVHVNLPEGMKCSQCVVQWRYRTGKKMIKFDCNKIQFPFFKKKIY